jgi:hypothetical protein
MVKATKAKEEKQKPFYEGKQKHRTEGRHRLPFVGPESIKNLIRKETLASVASLPPPGSFFNEKMLRFDAETQRPGDKR